MDNPKYVKMMQEAFVPIPVSGPKLVSTERRVLWKNVCLVGVASKESQLDIHSQKPKLAQRECIIEMSRTKTKFYIIAIDLEINKYHVIELFRPQANKMIKACENSLQKLMTFLEFRFGTLCIKDQDMLMQYQLYMTPDMIKQDSQRDI